MPAAPASRKTRFAKCMVRRPLIPSRIRHEPFALVRLMYAEASFALTGDARWRFATMKYDYVAIPDADVPRAVEPAFRHVVTTYASEVNKTVGVWHDVPDDLLDFRPHEKTNT